MMRVTSAATAPNRLGVMSTRPGDMDHGRVASGFHQLDGDGGAGGVDGACGEHCGG
jgi:hypothetical protein